ncbi:MAG: hypothetical protein AAGK00_12940, partial [Pseudomonadota bacterium]
IACLRQRRIPFIKIEETALISHLMPFAAERMESRSSTQGERFFRASICACTERAISSSPLLWKRTIQTIRGETSASKKLK